MSDNLLCKFEGCMEISMRDSKYCQTHWHDMTQEDAPADNWKHRSSGMRCATCMWWVEKAGDNPSRLGRCRKNAPTMSGFPATFPTDFCGQHKLDEAKA